MVADLAHGFGDGRFCAEKTVKKHSFWPANCFQPCTMRVPHPHKILKNVNKLFYIHGTHKKLFDILGGVVGHAHATFSKNVDNYGF